MGRRKEEQFLMLKRNGKIKQKPLNRNIRMNYSRLKNNWNSTKKRFRNWMQHRKRINREKMKWLNYQKNKIRNGGRLFKKENSNFKGKSNDLKKKSKYKVQYICSSLSRKIVRLGYFKILWDAMKINLPLVQRIERQLCLNFVGMFVIYLFI